MIVTKVSVLRDDLLAVRPATHPFHDGPFCLDSEKNPEHDPVGEVSKNWKQCQWQRPWLAFISFFRGA